MFPKKWKRTNSSSSQAPTHANSTSVRQGACLGCHRCKVHCVAKPDAIQCNLCIKHSEDHSHPPSQTSTAMMHQSIATRRMAPHSKSHPPVEPQVQSLATVLELDEEEPPSTSIQTIPEAMDIEIEHDHVHKLTNVPMDEEDNLDGIEAMDWSEMDELLAGNMSIGPEFTSGKDDAQSGRFNGKDNGKAPTHKPELQANPQHDLAICEFEIKCTVYCLQGSKTSNVPFQISSNTTLDDLHITIADKLENGKLLTHQLKSVIVHFEDAHSKDNSDSPPPTNHAIKGTKTSKKSSKELVEEIDKEAEVVQ
ncbi:hypothetical protein F5I97DRAFT_1829042 [Phlebopus sp. FC_14]|nr:hypothetical protein F5I97DRAFT_1829042 [Phlebopus sp. FC_14]